AALLTVPYRMFVVGKGPLGRYRRLAARLGVADQVVFTGPQQQVERFYRGCDLFVFPTLYDPFSNATLEALASGLPVITTVFNGVSELISEGENGTVLADPLDARALARAIERLAPAGERQRQGRAAAATARPFTMERNVRETMAVIATVSGEEPTTAGEVAG
ncbi:MAG TPA: glycosyltransferase family 4 protein, partial [Geobacteraceae bacterium]